MVFQVQGMMMPRGAMPFSGAAVFLNGHMSAGSADVTAPFQLSSPATLENVTPGPRSFTSMWVSPPVVVERHAMASAESGDGAEGAGGSDAAGGAGGTGGSDGGNKKAGMSLDLRAALAAVGRMNDLDNDKRQIAADDVRRQARTLAPDDRTTLAQAVEALYLQPNHLYVRLHAILVMEDLLPRIPTADQPDRLLALETLYADPAREEGADGLVVRRTAAETVLEMLSELPSNIRLQRFLAIEKFLEDEDWNICLAVVHSAVGSIHLLQPDDAAIFFDAVSKRMQGIPEDAKRRKELALFAGWVASEIAKMLPSEHRQTPLRDMSDVLRLFGREKPTGNFAEYLRLYYELRRGEMPVKP